MTSSPRGVSHAKIIEGPAGFKIKEDYPSFPSITDLINNYCVNDISSAMGKLVHDDPAPPTNRKRMYLIKSVLMLNSKPYKCGRVCPSDS